EPAEDEGRGVAVGRPQVDVDAPGAGQHRAQLRQREGTAEADEAEGHPQPEDGGRIPDVARERVGLAEDAAADGGADDDGQAAPEPDDPREAVVRLHFDGAASLRYTWPALMTKTTRRRAVMSLEGSPSTPMRSACMPGATAPVSSWSPRERAAREVADTTASMGGWPPCSTRHTRSSALRPWAPATASVP